MKPIFLLSGGLDSMTALADVLSSGAVEAAGALTIDYGQRNAAEMDKAERLASAWGIETWRRASRLLSDPDPRQEIPGRNTVFLALALETALVRGFDTIVTGSEPEDVYADSSAEFIARASALFEPFGVRVIAPLKRFSSNQEVLRRALDLGVPLHLVHPSLGPSIDGACKTSKRFLAALHREFPGLPAQNLLTALGLIHRSASDGGWSDATYGVGGSTMAVAALFSLASVPADRAAAGGPLVVFSPGPWGDALDLVNRVFFSGRVPLAVRQTSEPELLEPRWSALSLGSPAAQWGLKQAFWRLPRPYRVPGVRLDGATEEEAESLRSLGYLVNEPGGVCLSVRR